MPAGVNLLARCAKTMRTWRAYRLVLKAWLRYCLVVCMWLLADDGLAAYSGLSKEDSGG